MTQENVQVAPGLEALLPLVGKWHTEGQQLEGPLGPAAPLAAVETFEWLDGGHFLVHRLDGRFGSQPAACVELIGKDANGIFARTYYNDGKINDWRLAQHGQQLVMTGDWSGGSGGPFKVRYTMIFTDIGNTLEGKWEQSSDGETWRTFLEARATKAQPLPTSAIGA